MKRFIMAALAVFSVAVAGAKVKPMKGVEHVILIGLDGWGAYSLPKADMPQVKKMMGEGAWTLEARSVLPSSSACNWKSAVSGASPEIHGFTTATETKPSVEPRMVNEYGKYPTIFYQLRGGYPDAELGCIYEWGNIGNILDKEAASTAIHVTGAKGENVNPKTAAAAEKYIREKKPMFAMIVFDEPDHAGHSIGHDTDGYYAKLAELDGYIARIVEAAREAGILDKTVFMLMADHGGRGKGHGGKTMQEMQIPFVMWGPGIRSGYELQGSMMIYDIAPTIAHIFDVPMPQPSMGRPVTEAFVKR